MKFILALLLSMPCLVAAKTIPLNNPDEVKVELAKPGPVVLLYGTTWCPACENFKPVYEKLSDEVSGVRFYTMDCDKLRLTEHKDAFQYIPTTFVGKSGQDLRDNPCKIGEKGRDIKTLKEEITKCLGN